jgi:uncharacterized protein (TIGR00369 family)
LAAIDGADRTDRQRRGSIQAAAEFGRDAADNAVKKSQKSRLMPTPGLLAGAVAWSAHRAMTPTQRNRGATMPVPDFPSFTKLLGVNVLHRSPERTEAELTVREELCNRRGVLHGGAVMALGDALGGMTASISLPADGRTATIESKTNFFAAVPKGDTARAICMPLHRGRTTIVLETRITRGDGKLAAIVTQTQLIFERKAE